MLSSHGSCPSETLPSENSQNNVYRTEFKLVFFVEHSSGGEDSMPGLSQGDFCGQLLPPREGDTREGESLVTNQLTVPFSFFSFQSSLVDPDPHGSVLICLLRVRIRIFITHYR
jgi:hypothetical protein